VGREERWRFCRAAKKDGVVRRIGVTSHQRPLAAEMADSGELDLLMIRYNAAHRGAERDVFPATTRLGIPVISYTATRWVALMKPTSDDPPGFKVPPAADWYRFALQHPAVSVTLCAPHSREELDHDLTVLATTGPLDDNSFARLAEHGARVRKHAGQFA
jgi:aryl-alcohol dehydrogenase-like predicted oxidoreductase